MTSLDISTNSRKSDTGGGSAAADPVSRLRKVQQEVRKLTQEALKQQQYNSSDILENDDPNASFHLSMQLFGKEPSAIEKAVQEKLNQMENDLQSLSIDILNNEQQQQSAEVMIQKSSEQIEEESKILRIKINFLKQCSQAREYLDESITLSTQMLAPNEEPQLVQSTNLLIQANDALSVADQILEGEEDDNNVKSSSTTSSTTSKVLTAAYSIVDSIRSACRRQKIDIIATATKLWYKSIANTTNTISVTAIHGLEISYNVLELFQNKQNDNTLEMILRKFTRNIYNDIFHPLIQAHVHFNPKSDTITIFESDDKGTTTSSSSSSKSSGPTRRLEWNNNNLGSSIEKTITIPTTPNITAWKDTLVFIQRILTFVADHVFLQRPSICEFAALRFFGKPDNMPNDLNLEYLGIESRRLGDDNGLLLQPLMDAMEKTCIPHYLDAKDVGTLHTMQEEMTKFLVPFLDNMENKKLLDGNGRARLSNFTKSFEQMYVDNRRCILLNDARDMLVKNDYHNTVQVGEDVRENISKVDKLLGFEDGLGVFKLHKSSISDTAHRLMQMCRSIMDEAVAQQKAPANTPLSLLPATLYKTAREVLDLFRAIVPVTHGHELANVPRTAAVLHNDCVFFSYHCLTLGLEYRPRFPEPAADDTKGKLLRQTCMFVDMVPLFRDMADRFLGDMLDKQAKQLVTLVGERITLMGEALRSEEILAEWSDAETALEAGTYHLKHLSQAWKPILSYDIFNRSMSYLIDVMFNLFLDQLAKAKDISSSACQFVHTLFLRATRNLENILEGDTSNSQVWDRFLAIGKFFDMSIGDIQVALSDGIFCSVTGAELTRLVNSCFDESPKRRALLKSLSGN